MVKALIHGGGCASQGGKVVYKDKEKGSGLSDHPDCYSSSSSHNTSQASHILYDPHINGNVVCALAVVNFHPYHGPCIEYVYSPELTEEDCTSLVELSDNTSNRIGLSTYPNIDPYTSIEYDIRSLKTDLASILPWIPMLALPDGAHSNTKPDYVYTILPAYCGELMYGVSIYYRIPATQVSHTEEDDTLITRGYLQKAVMVISKAPFFDPNELYRGIDIISLIRNLGDKIWWIVKAVMLERRVIVYSSKARVASSCILAILACLPPGQNYLRYNSPGFGISSYTLERYGLPLSIFNKRCPVYTYVSLELMDYLYQCRGFLIGTSNSLLLSHRSLQADLIVDMDKSTVVISTKKAGKELNKMLRLDKGEKKLMKTIHGFTHGIPHILPPPPTTTNRPHLPLASYTTVHDNKMTDDINLDNPPLSRDPLYNGAQHHHHHQQQQVYDIPLSLEPSIGTTGLEQQEGMVNDDTHDEPTTQSMSSSSSSHNTTDGEEVTVEGDNIADDLSVISKATDDIISSTWNDNDHARNQQQHQHDRIQSTPFANEWRATSNYAKWRSNKMMMIPNDSKPGRCEIRSCGAGGKGYWHIRWDNGDEYIGELLDGKRDGRGRYISPSHHIIYDGNWSNDVRKGWGELVCDDGGYIYDGEWKDDKREGEGRSAHKATGEKYSGHFSNNRYHGYGCLVDTKRNVYEGEFRYGMKEGVGRSTDAEGNTYIGEYHHNKRCGNGQLRFRTAPNYPYPRVYVGDFKDDVPNGSGTCVYLNKYEYEGSWISGQRCGSGILTCVDEGVTIEGEWSNGRCCITRVQVAYTKQGYIYAGMLDEEGYAIGHGILKGPNQYMHDGCFNKGLRDGHGMEVYNGVTINGVWSKGKLIHTTQEDNDGDGAEQQHIEAISIITIKIPDIVINGQLSDTFPPPIPLIPE
ncbi:hypothetical protein Pmar_PMAR018749 [Perkinsus marinus ATCC 50983]|uniref:AVL9/DENND6 domain-containing protein n=1 Tax=Perkinsus marinus (strain ATCC 50983 / TXsc) TaxID=423536 RepID=C5KJ95_PERM5|nr:hypothetical protein Pmar_PMAR018749 [Perkinsus marinus ATCC 50983]EER15397.1 hypothetical protein Pmar_PMAR018749 [Perkinsus marinus ATCC 50983]|eukprot:XP_002783601.1 hypothetical protein Pmar_PMAR018749 [Perkinsus marinus ATCC 50983]